MNIKEFHVVAMWVKGEREGSVYMHLTMHNYISDLDLRLPKHYELHHLHAFHSNTVFGFLQDFYVGMEQITGNHLVKVGYQKGATQAEQNLINLMFDVHDSPSTASKFIFSNNN